ncbi:type II secretion system protein, partial [Candidatus Roizmanbacteria bacterium]|nr:type II secretion system protein [Candidatus Roizmanbacteria bacterium]
MKKAFTLLEILIVLGIIGVVIGAGIASYSTAQKKARDTKRQGDLHAAQAVMEQCFSAAGNFQYPLVGQSGTNVISASCTVNGTTYSFSITDPLNNATNKYTGSGGGAG